MLFGLSAAPSPYQESQAYHAGDTVILGSDVYQAQYDVPAFLDPPASRCGPGGQAVAPCWVKIASNFPAPQPPMTVTIQSVDPAPPPTPSSAILVTPPSAIAVTPPSAISVMPPASGEVQGTLFTSGGNLTGPVNDPSYQSAVQQIITAIQQKSTNPLSTTQGTNTNPVTTGTTPPASTNPLDVSGILQSVEHLQLFGLSPIATWALIAGGVLLLLGGKKHR